MISSKNSPDASSKSGFGIQEVLARAVLNRARQQGHTTIELRRDGRRFIYLCTLCSSPCYSEGTLNDHLRGIQHSSRMKAAKAVISPVVTTPELENPALNPSLPFLPPPHSNFLSFLVGSPASYKGDSDNSNSNHQPRDIVDLGVLEEPVPASGIEWIGCGQILLKEISSGPPPLVQAVWCRMLEKGSAEIAKQRLSNSSLGIPDCGVVIFPYSEAVGRNSTWKPSFFPNSKKSKWPGGLEKKNTASKPPSQLVSERRMKSPKEISSLKASSVYMGSASDQNTPCLDAGKACNESVGKKQGYSKDLSNAALIRALKRYKVAERICHICHQRMLPSKDVAALLNLKSGQLMCNSRNMKGAFHVFHTSCLIGWILLCEAKFWVDPSMATTKKQRLGPKPSGKHEGHVFCPECQGTGLNIQGGGSLESPRYRLGEVFEWMLQQVQAHKMWVDEAERWPPGTTGLLFRSQDEQHHAHAQGRVIPVRFLHLFAAGSIEFLLATTLLANPSI